MQYLMRLILLLEILCLLGCSFSESSDSDTSNTQKQTTHLTSTAVETANDVVRSAPHTEKKERKIVAKVGEKDIDLEELDERIKIKKFDLEWSLYELRQTTLDGYVNSLINNPQNVSHDEIEISLTPPMPPRLDIPTENRYTIGNDKAPIKIAVFCSYQSSPCMRIQPILEQLRLLYEDLIALVPYDFPMHFHRNGRAAANAARCAESFSMLEPYQRGLYADINNLSGNRYKHLADQLGINTGDFMRCYEGKAFDHLIQKDIDLGLSLNAGNVPLVFINGLYTKGPKTIATYIFYIESELKRLGVDFNDSVSESSLAVDEKLESPTLPASYEQSTSSDEKLNSERKLPPTSRMTLSREWLDAHLLNQTELEQSFKPAEHLVNEQYYLLRLEDIEHTDFYETLGLKERDVIMKVNDQWLHSGENNLFNELHNKEFVSVVVMRKGLPYRYDFEIK